MKARSVKGRVFSVFGSSAMPSKQTGPLAWRRWVIRREGSVQNMKGKCFS
jgi:hypothetical protein